jgi:hypothetical protein
MKQFNLEEYLINPNKKVITRSGKSARIICTNKLDNNYPVVALVCDGDCEKCYSYTQSGRLYTYQTRDCELDLFFAPVKKEGWINLFKINSTLTIGEVYNTEEEAKAAVVSSLVYISTVKIEWEE